MSMLCLLVAAVSLRGSAPELETTIEQQLRAGDYEAAAKMLEAGDLDPLARATLRGRLALASGKPLQAANAFAEAVKLAPDHMPLRLLWAHALLAAGTPRDVGHALEHSRLPATRPDVAQLLAAADDALGHPDRAYARLHAAARAHPSAVGVRQQLVLMTGKAGLFETCLEWARTLSPAQLGRDIALAAIESARGERSGLQLAHELAAGFPDDADIALQLGWALSMAGETAQAARAFARATALGADAAYLAAEHARASGRARDALRLNAYVRDNNRRIAQRFDIVFEAGNMARAVALAEQLPALSPRQRYSLAYAHFRLGAFAAATDHARELLDTAYAQQARILLRAMNR